MTNGAVILCGGRSQRMGRDKATLPFGPELMLQRVVRLLSEVVDPASMVIVAAQGQELPHLPAAITIARDDRSGRGPLEGLAAGIRVLPEHVDVFYATACDTPLLVPGFVKTLFGRLDGFDVAVPWDGNWLHPLSAVYRRSVKSQMETLLAADQLRLVSLLDLVRTNRIPTDDFRKVDPNLDTLRNLNEPADYPAALKRAGFESYPG